MKANKQPKATDRKATDPEATHSDPRWLALKARDAAADGRFFYSVSTTGVYCRPSCRARAARPEHIAFHNSAADAERAGFRACKRCRPDQPPLAERQAVLVTTLCRLIETAEQEPTLAELAQRAGLSRFHTLRLFRQVTGLTPKGYAAAQRAVRLRQDLAPGHSVTDAIYHAGYGSTGRLYAQADALLGMRPRQFRDGGRDVPIRFATGPCSLGTILVAASERGICAILLGDDRQELEHDLKRRFPAAQLRPGDAAFDGLVAQAVALVENPTLTLSLPLDIRGTAFQQRVWQALTQIPSGQTRSYSDLAAALGQPRATRAVAQACAKNAIAVVIPCHRVLRSDGNLAGYRWGVERKRTLLRREARN